MKQFALILITVTIIGCQVSDNRGGAKQLSSKALEKFVEIFGGIPFNGKTYSFTTVEVYNPNFNWNIMSKKDTSHFSYFIMKSDSFELKLAVNSNLCFASLISEDRGFDYVNQFTIHPNDFSWLNKEGLETNYDCINNDELLYREASYDKNILGIWNVDSTFNNDSNQNITSFEFSDSLIVLNNSIIYAYEQSGYYLRTINKEEYIYKIFANKNNMVFYNNLNENLVTYYCSKNKNSLE